MFLGRTVCSTALAPGESRGGEGEGVSRGLSRQWLAWGESAPGAWQSCLLLTHGCELRLRDADTMEAAARNTSAGHDFCPKC